MRNGLQITWSRKEIWYLSFGLKIEKYGFYLTPASLFGYDCKNNFLQRGIGREYLTAGAVRCLMCTDKRLPHLEQPRFFNLNSTIRVQIPKLYFCTFFWLKHSFSWFTTKNKLSDIFSFGVLVSGVTTVINLQFLQTLILFTVYQKMKRVITVNLNKITWLNLISFIDTKQ